MKKLLTGARMEESSYTGPGTVALAPIMMGDITTLQLQPGRTWKVGKDGYLARTLGVEMESHRQKLGAALLSGDGLFVYHLVGSGLCWVYAYGALDSLHASALSHLSFSSMMRNGRLIMGQLQPGEQHILDNGHLVAWDCEYKMEKAGSGGIFNSMKTGEGVVCRLTGPGTVYYSTRNLGDFEDFIRAQVPSS